MVKTPTKPYNSLTNPPKGTQIHKATLKRAELQRSKQKQAQFLNVLKELHEVERRGRALSSEEQCLAREIREEVCRFFNKEKKYGEEELDRYVVYLANVLNLSGERGEVTLEGQFRGKIRKFMSNLGVSKQQGKSKHSKMHALLYILAIFIYKQNMSRKSTAPVNRWLQSDKILVKQLLGLTLVKYKRMDKFYGVIIMHLSNHPPSKKTNHHIIKSVLNNIAVVDHQPTLSNLLVLLRGQKNKVSINYTDVVEGGIFDYLIQSYPKHIHKYLSYQVIDYLNYLIALFPTLANRVPNQFISNILSFQPHHLHHPFHKASLISFTHSVLKYSEPQQKQGILQQLIAIFISNKCLGISMAHILSEHQVDQGKMFALLQSGYFSALLEQINGSLEHTEVRRVSQQYRKIVNRFQKINGALSSYLHYQLEERLRVIGSRVSEGQVYQQ